MLFNLRQLGLLLIVKWQARYYKCVISYRDSFISWFVIILIDILTNCDKRRNYNLLQNARNSHENWRQVLLKLKKKTLKHATVQYSLLQCMLCESTENEPASFFKTCNWNVFYVFANQKSSRLHWCSYIINGEACPTVTTPMKAATEFFC